MNSVAIIPVDAIDADNDRKYGGDGNLDILALSIRELGMINPILVREVDGSENGYRMIAGRRRLAAAKLLGLETVPAQVLRHGSIAVEELTLAENVNRQDMHPLDEAVFFKGLKDGGMEVEEIARRYDRTAAGIYHRIRLTALTESARLMFRNGKLNLTGASLLASLAPEFQDRFTGEFGERDETPVYVVESFLHRVQHNRLEIVLDGQCEECRKRTHHSDNELLFDDLSLCDVCFDDGCYRRKWIKLLEGALLPEREKRRDVRNIIKLNGPYRINVLEQDLVLGGEEYRIEDYCCDKHAMEDEPGAFAVWEINFYSKKISVNIQWRKKAEEETEEEIPRSKFGIEALVGPDRAAEMDPVLNERYGSKHNFNDAFERRIIEKLLAAERKNRPGAAKKLFFDWFYEWNDCQDKGGEAILKAYTGSNNFEDVLQLDGDALFAVLYAMTFDEYVWIPTCEESENPRKTAADLLAFSGLSAEEWGRMYRETLEELVEETEEDL
jgi:ParB/RepB/Spo0J family partition protein